MYLSSLILHEFRNYSQLELSLSPGLFLFYGENAQGKTNLLEAAGMLATSGSFHATSDREVVNWNAPDHIARIQANVQRAGENVELEIAIFDPMPPDSGEQSTPSSSRNLALPANTPRKRVKINTIPKRAVDLIGQLNVVLFAPTDLSLVDGSPDARRRFLDRALSQVHPRYWQALLQYRKVVTQRSALLKRIREKLDDPRMLDYLDTKLVSLANILMFERQRMLTALNEQTYPLQEKLSGGREHLQLIYRPSFTIDPAWNVIEAEEHYLTQLRELRRKEIMQGVCLLGPHRDDLEFLVNGVNMLTYGSRGQQRTSALSAKLAELAYMRQSTGDEPILLLDDVFSELDTQRRAYLLQEVLQHEQVLLTATEVTSFPQEILAKAHMYEVKGGEIQSR